MAVYFSGVSGTMEVLNPSVSSSSSTGNTQMYKVRNMTVQTSMTLLETTTLKDTDQCYIPSLRSTSGTCELLYYQSTPQQVDARSGSFFLQNLMKEFSPGAGVGARGEAAISTPVRFTMKINDGSTNGRRLIFDSYLTNVGTGISTGEIVTVQVSFTATGAFATVDI